MLTKKGLLLVIAGLIFGTFNTLGLSVQSKQFVTEGGIHKTFFHPYMQATIKPVSYALILVFLLFSNRKFQKQTAKSFNPLLLIIPITFQIIANCFYFFALNFVPSSSYQMLRGANILVTYFISVFLLKREINKQKMYGCLLVIVGLVAIGVNNTLFGKQSTQKGSSLIGYAMIMLGVLFTGMRYIYEQQLVKHHKVDPFWVIGLEGLFGIIISAIYIPLLSMVSCPFGESVCVINDSGKMVFQDFSVFMRELLSNHMILIGGVVLLLTFSLFCLSGIILSKEMGALARSIVDVTRSLFIWFIGIIVTLVFGKNDSQYRWQSLEWKQVLGQFLAFSILMLGNLIYYEFINLRCIEDSNEEDTNAIGDELVK